MLILKALGFLSLAFAAQLPMNASITSTTLVTVLSADPDYESLLRLIQLAHLIPTLNRLSGSTLFAPTNDAISRHPPWKSILDDHQIHDNVQEQLRQQLYYHLINYTVSSVAEQVTVLKTLHYPHTPVSPPSREPPPNPPWLPIPEGTLGEEPQRLRLGGRGKNGYVGVDAFGKGGVQIVKGQVDAGNGAVLGISEVLEPPSNLASVLSQHDSVSYFHKVLTPEIEKLLNSTPELTLFLPINEAWDALDQYERIYLESKYATDDLNRILNMHAVARKGVKWSDSFEPALKLKTIDGTTLEIVVTPEKTMVSTAELIQPDIYASNGVLHLVSSLLIPEGTFRPTPEKLLLSLDCSRFVSFIHESNLTFLINNTDTKYTILAPSNDVLSIFSDDEIPKPGSEEMEKLLRYHFIPGKWTPEKFRSGMLIETALQEPGLGGSRQVLSVDVGEGNENDDAWKSLRFGGATVMREPVRVRADNILIYFISKPIVPPSDAIDTVLPMLDFSSFIAYILASSVGDKIRNTANTTLLIPPNDAFERLGLLVSGYLLAPSSKADLEKVLLHHSLSTVRYAEALENGTQRTFPTNEGSDLSVSRENNGTIFVSASGGWAGMKSRLRTRDILTQTGVVHEVSDILIPRSVELTMAKLMKAAKGSTMITMVTKAGLDWVLNGTTPPEGSPWSEQGLGNAGWVLLCPTDTAFEKYNVSELYADKEKLISIVSQHLIPYPSPSDKLVMVPSDDGSININRPLLLEDSVTYSTLLSPSSMYGDLVFKESSDAKGGYIVGIKGARGTDGTNDWARVLSWGRSTGEGAGGVGGVIRIDRLLVPYYPPWWTEYGAPLVVGVLGIFVIAAFFYGVRKSEADSPAVKVASATAENVKAFVAGGFGGVCAVLVGHPFDLTKTRLQTASSGTYTGAIDVVKKTLARDGVSGLYRGIVPPLLGVTPIFAVSFWAYDASKKLILAATPNRSSEKLSIPELAAAGFLSAVPATAVTAPVERAKVLLQVQGQGGSEQKYKGVIDVMRHLYKEGGLRSIFRGSGATLARDGPGSAAYFAAYEVTKKSLTPAGSSPSDLNLGVIIFSGGMAGVAMWSLAIPPDVIKSRIQSAPSGTYSGFMDCARKTIARDGAAALWKGFGPAMARAFPANAATFLGVEASRKALDKLF
ncbi:carnitine/acyl carnitine carrier [Rhodocollybia butyracea]|uniref:Carnitine/acyl carnitine carrier n=1 Tax=Rhodocollybia butyracea TaxID=206335 RepID=A0A9P5Q0M9_9AGAR|nr:carnitine/acyl carnitine carrier [Rhodocollybia butyracea]